MINAALTILLMIVMAVAFVITVMLVVMGYDFVKASWRWLRGR